MNLRIRAPADTGRVILGSLLYTAGSAFQYATPAYLGDLKVRLGIGEAQMGSLTAAESTGVALASLLSILWLTRGDRRSLAITAALLCTALDGACLITTRVDLLLGARFLAGLLGEGVLFSLAFVVLGSTRNPDRSFGIGLTSVVMVGSLILGGAAHLNHELPGSGVLLPLAVLPLGVLAAVRWMPKMTAPAMASGTVAGGSHRRLAIVAVLGMTLWFSATGAFWTFAESAAAARHIPGTSIGIALALGNLLGLLGSLGAAWQGERWGRLWPLVVASVALCLSVIGFAHSGSALGLTAALSAFNGAWNYAAIYQMALVASLDHSRKVSLFMSAAQVAGFAAGGFLSGLAITQAGYGALTPVVALLVAAGMLVLALCFRRA